MRLEQTGQERNQSSTDQSDAAASHQLLHTLGLSAGVIITIAFEQVDDTPNGQTGTQGDNESLQNTNSGSKKCHKSIFAESKRCLRTDHNLAFSSPFKNLLFRLIFESGHFVLAVLIYLETARSGSCNLIGSVYFKDFVDILRFGFEMSGEVLLNIEVVLVACVGKILVVRMLRDVVLVRHERSHTA